MAGQQPEDVVESLRLERLTVQKKTFTKWANVHLQKYGLHIDDLFADIGDGLRLMKLLESLTGEKLGKPAKGSARINKIENVSRCIAFIHSKKMRLENISSEDIVDGKPHLILGLLWTIILRCEIWKHQQDVNESEDDKIFLPQESQPQYPVQKIAKDSLMLWCQSKTNGYPGVRVRDFHKSWRDGLAFNAVIHSHVPSLVDFYSLKPEDHIYNLNNAFNVASDQLCVPRLLDPEDVDTDNPDEKSILIYVSTLSKGIANFMKGVTGGKRIANILVKIKEIDDMKVKYNKEATELLEWIHAKVDEFAFMESLQSLEDIQQEITKFKEYRTNEKPKRNDMKNEVEALLFAIQMKRLGQTGWIPQEETSPAEIQKAWGKLERAEHEHEIEIRNQLKEQERLENLAYKFESKRSVRDGYLKEMQKVLTDPNYGANIKQADATFKKHEAIRTGILAREIMLQDLFKIADILVDADYRRKNEIIKWKNEMEGNWNYVLRLLEAYDERFSHLRQVISNLEEMESMLEEMKQVKEEMILEADPLDIDSSLQKQAVREVQLSSWEETVRRLEARIQSQDKMKDANVLQNQLRKLRQTHDSLTEISAIRRDKLEALLKRKQQLEIMEEMMAWISEMQLFCIADLNCKDLASALYLQKKNKSLGSELQLRKEISEEIQEERFQSAFTELEELWEKKSIQISLAVEAYQYLADANECASWILEKLHLLSSLDYGSDELTCQALFLRHLHIESEILANTAEIQRLRQESERICDSASASPKEIIAAQKVGYKESSKEKNPFAIFSKEEIGFRESAKQQISESQAQIEESFAELRWRCEDRKKRLYQSSMYFRFRDGCAEMEKWMREKERMMDTNEFGHDADEVEKNFEAFITDLAAHGLIIEELQKLAETLEKENSDQSQTAKLLFDDVQRRWQHLRDLTSFKERNLKGFTSVLLAQRICDETFTWLKEKNKIDGPLLADDITTLDMLRRRQEALERELVPAEERVKQAVVLSENVANAYPEKKDSIERRIRLLEDQWEKFQVKIRDKQKRLEESAIFQIFRTSANALVEWTNMMVRKLSVREKIGDMSVAESVIKDHADLGEQIAVQEDRFQEAEHLSHMVLEEHEDVLSILRQLEEAKNTVNDLWQEKDIWLRQTLDLHIFNREADQLHSVCASQDTLLGSAQQGDTLGDVEILIKHHDAFTDTLKAQQNRFQAFHHMTEKLIAAGHPESEYIDTRCRQVLEHRQKIKEKAEIRKQLLLDAFQLQELKADAQEMAAWISEKKNLAAELAKQDTVTNLRYKLKRQQTFEAEVAANQERLKNICLRGESMTEDSNFSRGDVASIIEELSNSWDVLRDQMESNRKILQQAIELRSFSSSVENALHKLEEITRASSSSNYGKDLRSVKQLLKELEVLDNDRDKVNLKVGGLIQQGQKLIEANISPDIVQNLIEDMQQKMNATEFPLLERKKKLETCQKFHQFKSDVDRELLWISEQMTTLSAETPRRNLIDAQKFQKKIDNMEVSLEGHKVVIEKLLEKVLTLVVEDECPVDVTTPSKVMEEEWNHLLELFSSKQDQATAIIKAQMFYGEAGEIDSWTSEKLQILSNTEYGKDEDAVIKLLTKHQTLELEIDSYKGLVDELASQAEALIETNHPDTKIIKNRMEVINQEMKNIQKLCTVRRQKLLESKSRHEFNKETEELKTWISEQMSEATSEDYGEDYEHVLVLHQSFEFFRSRVEGGSKRIIQYEDFSKRLINSNCYFVDDVKSSLEYLSSRWSELVECIEARSFKMEAAAEIHRYHRDVTDILSRIHSHYRSMPQDLGNTLSHAQDLLKKHDKIENELLGLEAQVHLLLEDSQRLQDAYPGGNEEHIQMQLSLVIENWNLLQRKVSSRKADLLTSQRIHKFLATAREHESWAKEVRLDLESEIRIRDVQQMENDHKALRLEIETRLSLIQPLYKEGESLLDFDIFVPQIEEKLSLLTEVQKRVQEAWDKRSKAVQQKKDIFLFFHEAKQIQASFTKKEVQLCGSETKETVEDIDTALRKHLEFQKTMDIQEEKFMHWKQQGENILKERGEESQKIEKMIEDLSSRRKRLLEFSAERSKTLSDALQHAEFKRDTIEAEAWIQEKKNKLRLVLKNYNQLTDEEKIKCLQKLQTVQAELDAQEPFIANLVQQSKEISAGQEVRIRLQLTLEGWEEVKENAARLGDDLLEARDMIVIHDCFEKSEAWIKEKELMIQANDVGKDFEHCIALQSKLDDVNSESKVDDILLKQMKELAIKLSRKDDQKGVYIRYERICERWNYLKEEIYIYRKKLKDAAQVHAFIKDVDDTIERIREKTLVLTAREEVKELNVVEGMQRKLDLMERDLYALDCKMKEQENQAHVLAERHQLSVGRINDRINQAQREWSSLQQELKSKKQYMESAYISLKFMKEVNDFCKTANEIIAEMEFGEMPADSTDALSLLQVHNDLQPQIVTRQEEIKELYESGKRILRLPGCSVKDIENCLKVLEEMSSDLDAAWQNRFKRLSQSRDLQIFVEKAKQVENWLASKEALLANQDFGDSMSSVQALIRKHENFEESCLTHFDKVLEIEKMYSDLMNHDDVESIQSRCSEICKRRDALEEACRRRGETLQDAKTFQQLLLDIYEISNWMAEKIQVASDESYRDLTNLLSKTQKHAAFEAEILANHSRVVAITQKAEKLLEANHFASDEIRRHVDHLQSLWGELMDSTNLRKERLGDAYNALQFKHKLEDINSWLEEAIAQIQSEDYGANVASLQDETNKHQELQKEAEEYAQNLKLLSDFAEQFQKSDHFSKDEIISSFRDTLQRFRSVEDSLHEKETALQEAILLAGLDNDIKDELSWIEENIAACNSEEYFDGIMSVQALQKKLQALKTEMSSREPLISSVVERGKRCNNDVAEASVQYLEQRFQDLKDSISLRQIRLADALESQTYYFEATQAEMWIKEKLAQVSGYEAERNIYAVQAVQKKLSTIEAATDGFRQSIQSLQELSSSLIERGHFDSQNIQLKQDEVNDQYEQLRQNILKKTAILREKEDFFIFQREVKDLMSQLRAISNVANSADQGRDVEHVESLLQKFENFRNRLRSNDSNVKALQQRASSLIDECHSESQNVEELVEELEALWLQCKESADNRYKALNESKLIHSFYKSADETVSWIHEKEVAMSSEDYGHDLESIKTLLGHHDTLQGDLKAIEQQVHALEEETTNLCTQFPDSQDEIEAKYRVVTDSWQKCKEKAVTRKEKLLQSEQLQSYFDEARDFHAWICEMSALLTSNELPNDVAACEALLAQHEGYNSDIDARTRSFYLFEGRGEEIIASGHFMAEEIRKRIQSLSSSFKDLLEIWNSRRKTYEQNLDLQLFKKKIKELETWLQTQEHNLAEDDGQTIEEVEYLIQKHEQFEKKITLYEAKFLELQKATKLEEEFCQKKEEEIQKKSEGHKLAERQKFDEIRRKEEERILEERRRERTETDTTQNEEFDDDFLPPEPSPSDEPVFPRIGSRSFKRKPSPLPQRTESPIISLVPPTTAEGFLERKQEVQSGGKRATSRQWKTFYTVLCGQLLCFFKDRRAFQISSAAKPPVNILRAYCSVPRDYHKKKYVFRLELTDRSAFLFEAPNEIKRQEWLQKINYTASLPPNKQLMILSDDKHLYAASEEKRISIDESYKRFSLSSEEAQMPTIVNERNNSVDFEVKNFPVVREKRFNSAPPEKQVTADSEAHRFVVDATQEIFPDVLYDDPFPESDRTLSLNSYDESKQSPRSSVSNQSSYVTAAASTSSISTLQDMKDVEGLSSDEDQHHSMPDTIPSGEASAHLPAHQQVKKRNTIPAFFTTKDQPKSQDSKGRWKFSLRRRP